MCPFFEKSQSIGANMSVAHNESVFINTNSLARVHNFFHSLFCLYFTKKKLKKKPKKKQKKKKKKKKKKRTDGQTDRQTDGLADGQMEGRKDGRTNKQTENLPILQDFVPPLGPLPKKRVSEVERQTN